MDTYFHIDNAYAQQPLAFDEIFLIQLGRIFYKEGMGCEAHLHRNWFELTIVTDGKGIVATNDVNVTVKSGDIYLSFPAESHQITSDKNAPLRYDFFAFYTTNEEINAELDKISSTFQNAEERIFHDERIATLISGAIAEFCDKDKFSSQKLLTNIFEEVIIYLIRDFQEKKAPALFSNVSQADILCYQLMNYIDTHIFDVKSLQQLSDVTNYNYNYLSTIFKKTTHQTLSEYYQNSKLKTAKLLIQEKKLKISQIAELLNYSSVYVFSRAYKNKYGVAPTQDSL